MICRKKVLILAANPENTAQLRLTKEFREISDIFREAKERDIFALEKLEGVRFKDLQRAMSEVHPRIVHFCGHADSQGIRLEDENDLDRLVRAETLSDLFRIHADRVEIVLINACSSEESAKAISQHINYVIGMNRAVEDEAAIAFTCGFYRAIGSGETIERAFQMGRNAMFESSGGKRRDISISPEDEANNSSAKETIENLPPVLFIKENLNPFPENEVNAVVDGFDAITATMSDPKVHDAVVTFKNDFQIACEQLQVLGYYKDVHDLLHELEFKWFNIVSTSYRLFPEDETIQTTIEGSEYTFQDILSQYDGTIKKAKLDSLGLTLVKDIAQSAEDLRFAIEESDASRLKKLVSCFKRLLGFYPARFNTKLGEAAKNLRLSGFLNAMKSIRDALDGTNLNSEVVNKIKTGTIALSELEHKLTILVEDHDNWQILDGEMRWLEDNLSELEDNWSSEKNKAEAFCTDSLEEWALGLKAEISNLDAAFTANNPAKISRYFRSFRRQVGRRFYQVDTTLKQLSDELTKVSSSLSTLIESIK